MDYLHLLLTNTKKPISHVITAVTGERFNHASIAFDAGLTESYSFNIAKNGFVREDRREWPTWTEFELYEVSVTASGRAAAYEYVKAVARGRQQFSFMGLTGVVIGRPLASREAMFCSEFVERACLVAGLAPTAPDPALATPETVCARPGSRRVATGVLHQYLLRSALTPGYRPSLVEATMNNLNEVCIELDLPLAEFSVGDYLRNPSSIGAIASSSVALGDAMAALVPPGRGLVVELGPGDGALTRRLVASGIRQEDLVLIELEEQFLATLRVEFPRAQLVHGSAERLLEVIGRHPVRSVVSGLPLRSLPEGVVRSVVSQVRAVLRANPGSVYVQFTYDPRGTPDFLRTLGADGGLRLQDRRFVLGNIPSAYAESMTL